MEGLEIIESAHLIGWKKIIEQWHEEIKNNINLTSGLDAAHIHAEHGNTHLFGIAAAKAGYATIREVIGTRNESYARLDLALISEKSLGIIESKWLEFDISKSISKAKIKGRVDSACLDAGAYRNAGKLFSGKKETETRIGLVFFVPHLTSEKTFNTELVAPIIEKIKKSASPNLIAWSFPEKARELTYWNRKYPGVIVVAKVSKHHP